MHLDGNKIHRIALPVVLWLASVPGAYAACDPSMARQDVLDVRSASNATVTVCTDVVLREELPDTLFGFNVMHYHFERDIWDGRKQEVPASVMEYLEPFDGALFRYPGGLVSNRFAWQQTIGPVKDRPKQKSVKWDSAARVGFGVDEYLGMVDELDGQAWFVLNLNGWDNNDLFRELGSDLIAETNADLARHMLAKLDAGATRYYQLGNELDRADYQWSHEKYIQRSRDTIDAMRKVDPDAHFVAFLREFDWTYKGAEKGRGVSRFQNFIDDVLTGLPEVNDFSMHFYYDAPDSDKVYQKLPWRLRHFRLAMDAAAKTRNGKRPNVWITEHARGIQFGNIKARDARPYTSNLAATVSTGDFLTALAQIPEVQGASWHSMNALPWQLFDPENDLQPNTVYWGLRVLHSTDLPRTYATYTRSPNKSNYAGGYDIRSTAFGNAAGTELGLWLVNRSNEPASVEVRADDWTGRTVKIAHSFVAGQAGRSADDLSMQPRMQLEPVLSKGRFSGDGSLTLELPPSSVSSFRLISD